MTALLGGSTTLHWIFDTFLGSRLHLELVHCSIHGIEARCPDHGLETPRVASQDTGTYSVIVFTSRYPGVGPRLLESSNVARDIAIPSLEPGAMVPLLRAEVPHSVLSNRLLLQVPPSTGAHRLPNRRQAPTKLCLLIGQLGLFAPNLLYLELWFMNSEEIIPQLLYRIKANARPLAHES